MNDDLAAPPPPPLRPQQITTTNEEILAENSFLRGVQREKLLLEMAKIESSQKHRK